MRDAQEAEVIPLQVPWRPWNGPMSSVYGRVDAGWFDRQFGPPSEEDRAGQGFGEAVWAIRFLCGLECLIIVYRDLLRPDPLGRNIEPYEVALRVPEIEHVLRHLQLPADSIEWRHDQSEFKPGEREQLFKDEHSWEVWRQDDNGNAFLMQHAASERDAKCVADTFERRAHKQIYWIAPRRVDSPAPR